MKINSLVNAIVVGGTVVVSMGAANADLTKDQAGNLCSAGAGATTGASVGFIQVGFTPKCSTNTVVSAIATDGSVAVKSASTKGKTYYGGTTDTGTAGACSTTGFTTYVAPTASTAGC